MLDQDKLNYTLQIVVDFSRRNDMDVRDVADVARRSEEVAVDVRKVSSRYTNMTEVISPTSLTMVPCS